MKVILGMACGAGYEEYIVCNLAVMARGRPIAAMFPGQGRHAWRGGVESGQHRWERLRYREYIVPPPSLSLDFRRKSHGGLPSDVLAGDPLAGRREGSRRERSERHG